MDWDSYLDKKISYLIKKRLKLMVWLDIIIVIGLIIILIISLWFTIIIESKPIIKEPVKKIIKVDTLNVFVSVYNPVEDQTDTSPLITASLWKIPRNFSELRRCAVSRDLLDWHLNFKDTITLVTGDKSIDGIYIVEDKMNSRCYSSIDILTHRKLGKWKGMIIFNH